MTRKEQKEMRRQQIIKTALHLFVHQGYHGTKTCQISKEAGISEGLLFHYFPTKENLLEEIVKIGVSGMAYPLHMSVEEPMDFFITFTQELFRELKEKPFYAEIFVFMAQVLRTEGIPPKVKMLAASIDTISATVPIIQAGQKNGTIKEGDPLTLANLYWCSIQGIAEQYSANKEIPLPEASLITDMLKAQIR